MFAGSNRTLNVVIADPSKRRVLQVVIYELLDEMMDWGYPQITDQKILSEYIMQVASLLNPKS